MQVHASIAHRRGVVCVQGMALGSPARMLGRVTWQGAGCAGWVRGLGTAGSCNLSAGRVGPDADVAASLPESN